LVDTSYVSTLVTPAAAFHNQSMRGSRTSELVLGGRKSLLTAERPHTAQVPAARTSTAILDQDSPQLRVSEVIAALSRALDLVEGQSMGHALRTCMLGMRLAEVIGLRAEDLSDLYYALLLKDAGCSTNAALMHKMFGGDELKAKREVKTTDWTRMSLAGLRYLLRNAAPEGSWAERARRILSLGLNRRKQSQELIGTRCQRGGKIALKMGFSQKTAEAIRSLDEHWNGDGFPHGSRGQEIPLLGRILCLCQTLDNFASTQGVDAAFRTLEKRSGKWFDPELVRAARALEQDAMLWEELQAPVPLEAVMRLEPEERLLHADDALLDNICEAFGGVVDAKSPFTYEHSVGVARVSVLLANKLGLSDETTTLIRRAALLHDIGKLGVPNSILDKPGRPTSQEWEVIQLHPYYSYRILMKISSFCEVAFVASAHHEKLDGTGYYRNLTAEQLPFPARLLAVADIYQALSEKRSYREALSRDSILNIIAKDVPHALDADCFETLKSAV
jgi:putative nucleotidyltransferase with HDIG domain